MRHEKIGLPVQYREKGVRNNGFTPDLTTYILDNYAEFSEGRKRPLVLICPGGGYEMLSEREAEPVAVRMNAMGFHAAVLRYSLKPMDFPAALLDLCEAVRCVRKNAARWNADESRIIVAGFSAGGHLAASLGVYWNSGLIKEYLPYSPDEIRPDALLLAYPVIKAGENSHEGSIVNVLGGADRYSADDVSLEKHVSPAVPPVFMWHTEEDGCVPLENSLLFALALRRHNIPFEYHVFTKGGHGLSLATGETAWSDGNGVQKNCAVWSELFRSWTETVF